MKYDCRTPLAVFLGPSLPQHKAERILAANYYPPVKMGDVYRLLATGVKTIVIIDGVFHNMTPVWQREIVAALDHGIAVFGASSMGALRAAELDRLGMLGIGKIYAWYRDGVIEGDDEVALLHAEAALGYQAISEPLVNIRHNLALAVEREILRAHEADALIAQAKRQYFGERSYHMLLQSPVVAALPPDRRADLTDLLTENPLNLKQLDAQAVLKHVAASVTATPNPGASGTPAFIRPSVDTAYAAYERFRRGLVRDDGYLVEAGAVFRLASESPEGGSRSAWQCAADFYLAQIAQACDCTIAQTEWRSFRAGWVATLGLAELTPWLRAVGLTEVEFDQILHARALRAHLLALPPESFGVDFSDQRQAVAGLVGHYGRQQEGGGPDLERLRSQLHERALAACLISAWALRRGIRAPQPVIDDFIANWEQREAVSSRAALLARLGLSEPAYLRVWAEQATYQWMIDQGPVFFGFGTYSVQQAMLEDLQVSGAVRALAERIEVPEPT